MNWIALCTDVCHEDAFVSAINSESENVDNTIVVRNLIDGIAARWTRLFWQRAMMLASRILGRIACSAIATDRVAWSVGMFVCQLTACLSVCPSVGDVCMPCKKRLNLLRCHLEDIGLKEPWMGSRSGEYTGGCQGNEMAMRPFVMFFDQLLFVTFVSLDRWVLCLSTTVIHRITYYILHTPYVVLHSSSLSLSLSVCLPPVTCLLIWLIDSSSGRWVWSPRPSQWSSLRHKQQGV